MDYRALQFWLNVVQVIAYFGLGIYVWFTNRQKATIDEIKELKREMGESQAAQADRCGKHHERTTKLEVALKTVPTHSDIGEVYERVNAVKGSVDEMNGTLKAINTQVNLLVEHHMTGGGG